LQDKNGGGFGLPKRAGKKRRKREEFERGGSFIGIVAGLCSAGTKFARTDAFSEQG
jgi:hypothetical protein